MRFNDTTRAAPVPTPRTRIVFNLAWYELFAMSLIVLGEALLFVGYNVLDAGVQALNVVTAAVIVVARRGQRVQLIKVLALISMYRVVGLILARVSIIYSVSIVLALCWRLISVIPTVSLYLLVAVYGLMLIPITMIVAHQKMNRHDLGLTGGLRLPYLIPFGILVGAGLGFIEYAILGNNAAIPSASASELIRLSIIMIFFVALVEELIFRVLLQSQLVDRSGAVAGILIASVLFGSLHAIYANAYELLFTTLAGVIFGVSFYKTKNLPFVVTMHAVDDIFLFGLLPFLSLALPH